MWTVEIEYHYCLWSATIKVLAVGIDYSGIVFNINEEKAPLSGSTSDGNALEMGNFT